MQTNNQTRWRHTNSNKTKRPASCYIVQKDMTWLLSSRLSLLPSSPTRKKLFCLFAFTRQRKAEAFKTMSRNKKAPSVDTPNYNSVVLKAYNARAPFIYERGTIDLDKTVVMQHQNPRLAVKLSHIYTTRTTTKRN